MLCFVHAFVTIARAQTCYNSVVSTGRHSVPPHRMASLLFKEAVLVQHNHLMCPTQFECFPATIHPVLDRDAA